MDVVEDDHQCLVEKIFTVPSSDSVRDSLVKKRSVSGDCTLTALSRARSTTAISVPQCAPQLTPWKAMRFLSPLGETLKIPVSKNHLEIYEAMISLICCRLQSCSQYQYIEG